MRREGGNLHECLKSKIHSDKFLRVNSPPQFLGICDRNRAGVVLTGVSAGLAIHSGDRVENFEMATGEALSTGRVHHQDAVRKVEGVDNFQQCLGIRGAHLSSNYHLRTKTKTLAVL